MFIANIDGKEVELKADQIKAKEEGYAVVTPDRVPDGYYTESALQSKMGERAKRAKEDARKAFLDDKEFHRDVFGRYDVTLDDEGNPKGLKPDVDIEQVKQNVAERLKNEYESKIQSKDQKLQSILGKAKKSSIIEGAQRIGIDAKYLEPLVEGGSPYLVREVEDNFDWNDEINDYALKDQDGTFAVDGNGFITPQKFFEQNTDRFKHMLKDQRQKGSGFGSGGYGSSMPKGNPAKWDTNTKLDYINKNGRKAYEKALRKHKAEIVEE